MDVLKQARGHLKGSITRAHNFVADITDDIDVESLEVRLERLEEIWKAFCVNQNELFAFHEFDGYGNPEADFEATEIKYFEAKGALMKSIRRRIPAPLPKPIADAENLGRKQDLLESLLNQPTSSKSVQKTPAEIELPPFKLTPFSGDYREWPGFRDMFLGSVDCKKNLYRVHKSCEIADSNYIEAWEKLDNRYNKPLYIINAYIESFLKLPTVTSADSVRLRNLTDNADEVIRGLKALRSESRDPWLIYLLLNKTDLETRKAWALENKNSEETTIQQLIDFLEKRCSALEISEPKNRMNKPVSRTSVSHNLKSLAASNLSCPKCKGNHSLPQCSHFLSMPILSRRSFVRDQRLCYNCLGSNHSSANCRVKTRCSNCQTRHHTLVHLNQSEQSGNEDSIDASTTGHSSNNSTTVVSHHIKNDRCPSGILPTVVVRIIDVTGKPQLARVLLDTGSQVSFVTERLVKRLGLRRRHARVSISGISSQAAGVTNGAVTVQLLSRFDDNKLEVDAYILNKITSDTPLLSFEFNNPLLWENLEMADPDFNNSSPIDILLGADKAWTILREGRRTDEKGNFIAQNTVFGWVITGNLPDHRFVSLHAGFANDLDMLLKSFWEIEEIPHDPYLAMKEDFADSHFSQTFSRAPDNKYVVELPFRQSEVKFGNTLSGALSRLSSMERRFARNDRLREDYCQFMKIYQELGHMKRIPPSEIEPTSGNVFYLPHHAVVTDKIRVVFDGSHKDSNGISLNQMLHVGPPLQRNLVHVCIRFRLHKYVFCADIVKMFRQIWIDVKHRDFQRIVWRESSEEPIGHYRLCTVTYGTSPAPFLSMRVLKQLAVDYRDKFPLASHSILRDFYVDDLLTGADSVSEVVKLKEELVDLLSCGGLQLSKWSSNCWPILGSIDCNELVTLDLNCENTCTKVLGLVWNPYRDIFTFKIRLGGPSLSLCTKRKLLSDIAKIFDPLGFLSPSTVLLKILFQELWLHKSKVGWDDPLPKEVAEKWTFYRQDLKHFEKVEIFRRCTLNSRCFDLIGFSDASEKAYSAVVYARSVSEKGQIAVQLVAAKTRVAPVKQLSIPRLELCGALLLARLIQLIRSSLDVKPLNAYAFCDSRIVLAWLASPPRRWSTFVANRTSEILDALPSSVWNHIRSEENPADCASRGIEPNKLLDLEIWWKGPAWLSNDFSYWPNFVSGVLDEVPEERKTTPTANVSVPVGHFLDELVAKISSWTKLIRIVGYILRFIKNIRVTEYRKKGFVSSTELLAAKQTCIRFAQREFQEEIRSLKSNMCVSNSSKLSSLSPFIDEAGLLRVGGRIAKAENVPFNIKHPIILPKNQVITLLILREAHLKFLHAGVTQLFTLVRQEFWVIGSRNLLRKIVFQCKECFRLRQNTSAQLMGNLPSFRLNSTYAFDHTGCDYAGPITLRLSKGRNPKLTKGYIALFICMATKALHLEVVSDLSTDAFLAALRRFIARRGKCRVLHSDNGTNFQGASRILSEWFQLMRSKEHNERISTVLATDNIKWEFIPPHSPHFGGLWESGVKCVKQHLRRVIGNNVLTFEEMSTLLSQIEAILNSRPLAAISDSDLNPLTPSHFLIGRPYTAILEPSYLDIPLNRLRRWELVQNMMQGFWHRWHTDYLTSLQQRPKWKQATRDLQIGDLVLVREPNLPPSKWALGRIEATHPGSDGHVRVVSIRSRNAIYKRPITRLALLPGPEIPSGEAAC